MTQSRPNGQASPTARPARSSGAPLEATTYRLLFVLARLGAAPESYRRAVSAVPFVGRDALRHADLLADGPSRACWSSKLRYLYTRCVRGGIDEPWFRGSSRWRLYWRSHRDNDLPAHVYDDGSNAWYHNGMKHRDNNDQPAVTCTGGTTYWYRCGKLHRDDDKPAVVWADGSREWYRYGMHHRNGDKPATIRPNGSKEWWRYGACYRSVG